MKLDQSNCLFRGDFVRAPAAFSLKIDFFVKEAKVPRLYTYRPSLYQFSQISL